MGVFIFDHRLRPKQAIARGNLVEVGKVSKKLKIMSLLS